MNKYVGEAHADSWARDQVLTSLGGRTVMQAIEAGVDTKTIWLAVHEALGLPPSER